MTIPSTTRKAGPLLGTSAQTAWPFTFKVFAEADIRVVVVDALSVETDMVLNTDYSVVLNANQETSPGGTVTYPISGSPLTIGSALAIVGDLDYDQPLDLPAGGNFSPTALENELDRIVMQVQQMREILNRALLAPVTSAASGQLPAPEANTLIGWNSAEDALQNVPLTALVTAQTYGSFTNDAFTGTGAQTTFALSANPVALANLQVFVDGLSLIAGTDYTLSSSNVIFTVAPSLNAEIIARFGQALVATGMAAGNVSFTPSGTIAATTVQAALAELDAEKAKVGTLAASGITGAAASGSNSDITSLLALAARGLRFASTNAVDLASAMPATGSYVAGDIVFESTTGVKVSGWKRLTTGSAHVLNTDWAYFQSSPVLGTSVATTSGTAIDFTGIPSGVKRITVMLVGVSTNGTSDYLIQIGAGSVSNTGYLGSSSRVVATVVSANYTTGFGINNGTQSAAYITQGLLTIDLAGSNNWVASGTFADSGSANTTLTGGFKSLGGTLDRIRLTTVNGTDTFDVGSVNIMYE